MKILINYKIYSDASNQTISHKNWNKLFPTVFKSLTFKNLHKRHAQTIASSHDHTHLDHENRNLPSFGWAFFLRQRDIKRREKLVKKDKAKQEYHILLIGSNTIKGITHTYLHLYKHIKCIDMDHKI